MARAFHIRLKTQSVKLDFNSVDFKAVYTCIFLYGHLDRSKAVGLNKYINWFK